jgi:hypothetical protein
MQARAVQAQEPLKQEQVLQPSSGGGAPSHPPPHAISVHDHAPDTQVHVLQPSPAGAVAPSGVHLPPGWAPGFSSTLPEQARNGTRAKSQANR